MAGDYSRITFEPQDDFAKVCQQQGHLLLDWEANLLTDILDRRTRAQTIDMMGHAVVPRETPTAFQITDRLLIGPGRMYVDGILVENHGAGQKRFDGALEEERVPSAITEANFLAYSAQPYWLRPAQIPQGRLRIYIDVFRREVTYLQAPDLVEQAVGEETTTRVQTVWQVKYVSIAEGESPSCDLPAELTRPAEGRLSTQAVEIPSDENPCILPPRGGYGGRDNRLYRCEIHMPGKAQVADLGEGDLVATFKWSRDNGSVAAPVQGIKGHVITLARTRRKLIEEFHAGDWIEILDDEIELDGRSGEMHKVKVVRENVFEIELATAPTLNIEASKHVRVVRWDQKGIVRDSEGNIYVNVDGSNGVIPVPPPGTSLILEAGVQVTFSTEPTPDLPPSTTPFRAQDYWTFAARTADASVERLDQAPPRGIHHHFAPLAIVTPSGEGPNGEPLFSVQDCRTLWPLEQDEVDCACTICVSADAHNSGKLTIQAAIERIKQTGGTVCLGPGTYELQRGKENTDSRAPIELSKIKTSVRIEGHGEATRLLSRNTEVAILVTDSEDVVLSDFLLVAPSREGVEGQKEPRLGAITILNSFGITVERCTVEVWTSPPVVPPTVSVTAASRAPVRGGIAIALGGFVLHTAMRHNRLSAGSGIVSLDLISAPSTPMTSSASKRASVTDEVCIKKNSVQCVDAGIHLGETTVHLGRTDIVDNLITGGARAGIMATGLVWPLDLPHKATGNLDHRVPPQLRIERNAISGDGDGIVVGPRSVRVCDNNVTGSFSHDGAKDTNIGTGIVVTDSKLFLKLSVDSSQDQGCEICFNHVSWMAGDGIAIHARLHCALISANTVQNILGSGVVMTEEAVAATLTIENNVLSNLGLRPSFNLLRSRALVGIGVVGVEELAISSNNITGLDKEGRWENVNRFGIHVFACSSIRVGGNDVSDIGIPSGNQAFGIAVEPSFERLNIDDNHVRKSVTMLGKLDGWEGLRVEAGQKAPSHSGLLFLLKPQLSGIALQPTNWRLFPLLLGSAKIPRGRETLSISGNVFESGGGAHAVKMAVVGTCTFSNNRCVQPILRHEPPVFLKAGALLVQSNYVEGPKERAGMEIDVPSSSGQRSLTVLGNICTKDIQVNGVSIDVGPWGPLNVLAE